PRHFPKSLDKNSKKPLKNCRKAWILAQTLNRFPSAPAGSKSPLLAMASPEQRILAACLAHGQRATGQICPITTKSADIKRNKKWGPRCVAKPHQISWLK